jgi:hypothetical protein
LVEISLTEGDVLTKRRFFHVENGKRDDGSR